LPIITYQRVHIFCNSRRPVHISCVTGESKYILRNSAVFTINRCSGLT